MKVSVRGQLGCKVGTDLFKQSWLNFEPHCIRVPWVGYKLVGALLR